MNIYTKPPEGSFKARYEVEFYLLKPRRRVMYAENRVPFVDLRWLIFSYFSRRWYERVVKEDLVEDDIVYWVKRGLLWLYPTEENKDIIREEVGKWGMGYYPLMAKRQTEIDHQRHLQSGNKSDGYKFKEDNFRMLRYNKH